MSSEIKCTNDHDDFCFVCGHHVFTTATQSRHNVKRRFVTADRFRAAYQAVFGLDPARRNVQWSPQVVCASCFCSLTIPGKNLHILTPMEWMAPKNHPHDCYFCQSVLPGHPPLTKKRESEIQYANVSSVKKPKYIAASSETMTVYDEEEMTEAAQVDFEDDEFIAPTDATTTGHVTDPAMDVDEGILAAANVSSASVAGSSVFRAPRPVSPGGSFVSALSGSGAEQRRQEVSSTPFPSPSSGSAFVPARHFSYLEPKPKKANIDLTQARLNDIVRDMDLPKAKAELLASRFNDLGLGKGMYLFYCHLLSVTCFRVFHS